MRDFQRARLYRAEREALGEDPWMKRLSFEECRQLVQSAARYVRGPVPKVVYYARRYATASAHEIILPRWAWIPWIVLHEYAHLLTRDGHGPEFAGTYLRLVRRFMGKEAADALRKAYRLCRVKYRRNSKI